MEEEVLFEHDACHVFRLPPTGYLSSALWEGNHIWTGKVQVLRRWRGNAPLHSVELTDTTTRELFGQCPLKESAGAGISDSFQAASDSSRCFVIRVEQGDQFANVGLNFEDKAVAFRFCTAVLERNKRLRLLNVSDMAGEAISRYGDVQMVERRAEGKIQVQLTGKLAPHVSPLGSAGVSGGTKDANFSLHALPKSNSTGSSRRILAGNRDAAVAGNTTPPPPAPAGSTASKATAFDPFGDFPEPPSAAGSSSTGRNATPPVLPTSAASTSPSIPSDAPPRPQNAAAAIGADPFEGVDALTSSTSGVAKPTPPVQTSNAQRGLDDYFA